MTRKLNTWFIVNEKKNYDKYKTQGQTVLFNLIYYLTLSV